MLAPKLRFKREDGESYSEWNKEKWSSLGEFVGSGTLSKSDLSDTGTPCILYGELYTKYGEIAHTIYSKTNAEAHTFSKADDVILPKSGEIPEDISTATCIPYDNVSLGGDLIVFRHNEKVIGSYLSYLISNRAKKSIASIAQGKSVVHINEKSLSKIELPYPGIEEQQKIANFLSNVDKVIMQSEAEVVNLEQQKKAAMQKIFSQEICFRREDGEAYPKWKEKQLGLIGKATSGSGFSEKYQGHKDLPIPFYKVSDMNNAGNEIIMSNSNNYVSEELLSTMRLKACHRNSIIFAKVGAALLLDRKRIAISPFLVDNNMMIFTPNNENVLEYVYYWFTNTRLSKYAQVGALPSFNAGDIESITIPLPHIEEQQKIADFLSAYDEVISYAKQELEKWKELKKGLLQQMFV